MDVAMSVVDFAGARLLRRVGQNQQRNQDRGLDKNFNPVVPLLIAHRGAHREKGVRENTLRAFDLAFELGADGIEFDLRKLKDGTLVVHHDEDLLRSHGRPLRLDNLSYQSLKFEAEDIPTLSETVQSLSQTAKSFDRKLHFFVELKGEADDWSRSDLDDLYKKLGPLSKNGSLLVMSLSIDLLLKVAEQSGFDRKQLVSIAKLSPLSAVVNSIEFGFGGATGHWSLFSEECIRLLRWAEMQSGVGFTDSEPVFRREALRGVNWAFTNRVREAQSWRSQILASASPTSTSDEAL